MIPSDISICGNRAVVAVDRAINDLRHGRAVRVEDTHDAVLAVAAEVASETALEELALLGGSGARLVLTDQRARIAGLAIADGASVELPIAPDTRTADLTRLATSSFGPDQADSLIDGAFAAEASPASAAALVLAKLARLLPAVLVVALDDSNVAMADDHEGRSGFLIVTSDDIRHYPRALVDPLTKVSDAVVPLEIHEQCRFVLFRTADGKAEHLAIVIGHPDRRRPAVVRLHSACLTGDLFGSLRCDCGDQLRTAVAEIGAAGGGVLLYLAQEGRGIGLANKLRAYRLQDTGLDTLDADRHLGFESDERTYHVAAEMLKALGLTRIHLLTNNPAKLDALQDAGIETVGRMPLVASVNRHNERYLRAKAERAGHLLNQDNDDLIPDVQDCSG
jgi:GTP cyclohydrolase II